MSSDEEKIVEIETALTHHEREITEINDLLFQQQSVIDKMSKEIMLIREQLLNIAPSFTRSVEEEEPPPHY